jgi:hypothetical protein
MGAMRSDRNRDPLDVDWDQIPGASSSRKSPPGGRDPLDVDWSAFAPQDGPAAPAPNPFDALREPGEPPVPDDRLSRDMLAHPDRYPKSYWRALQYEIERQRAANQPALREMDRDAFLEQIVADAQVSRELLRLVVRSFAALALRGPLAATRDGWHRVMRQLKAAVGSAVRMGMEDVRRTNPALPVPPPVPVAPPAPPWAIMLFERRRPTPDEIRADVAYWTGLPVRLVEALIRAYVRARFREPDGATPEGRSRILAVVREDLWDALLDAVTLSPPPPPQATPSSPQAPPGAAPGPQGPPPGRPRRG